MIGGGIFRADPGQGFPPGAPETVAPSWHGMLHFAAGGVGFACLAAACFVLARRFATERKRGWAVSSRATGVLFLAAFLLLAAGGGASGGASGTILFFTVAILLVSAWISLVSLHYYRPAK